MHTAHIIEKEEHKSEKDKGLNGNFQQSSKDYVDAVESMAVEQQYVNHAFELKQKVLCKDRDIKTQVLKKSNRKRNHRFIGKCFNCGKVGH